MPVPYEGAIYVLSNEGILARYDAVTGEDTIKGRITRDDNVFTSSPWAYNRKIFPVSETRNTYVVAASGDFAVEQVDPLGEMVQATPAMVGARLLLRTETRVYSIRDIDRPR